MRRFHTVISLIFVFSLVSFVSSGFAAEKRVYNTQRIHGEAPVIDGHINDPIWDTVDWSGGFRQHAPYFDKEPYQETDFKILYDNEALYVAFRAWDTEPDEITYRLARRDWFPGDWVEIEIDSRHDLRTAFSFTTSVSGTRGDEFISKDGSHWDSDWDPVWTARTAIDGRGWTAEVKIPLSQLRYSNEEEQVWGIQVMRRLFRKEERSTWQPVSQDDPGWVSLFGELHGIQSLRPPRRIELLPYTMLNHERYKEEAGNPYATGSDEDYDFGLDGKIGVTNDLTVDFTFNPDFGQVEADPSEVNLTEFETYFSEKRPFFIEGSNIYDFQIAPAITGGYFTSDNLFYSRRIGRRPHGYPDLADDEYANLPSSTSILGAGKLSGKTTGGLSIGLMEVVTAEERAEISGDAGKRKESVEPLTNYFVGRLEQDLREGATTLGVMLTTTHRDIPNEELSSLHDVAYSGGLDLTHKWKNRTYYISTAALFSHVRGDKESIYNAQVSSARYFQRPDADYVSLDTTRTSLSGHAGSFRFGKTSQGRFRFQTGVAWRSPGFEINDLGYMRSADGFNQFTWAGYWFNDPFSIFRRLTFNGNQWTNFDFGGSNTSNSFNVNSSATYKSNWETHVGLTLALENISNTALRGGPSSKWPAELSHVFSINSDSRRRIRIGGGISGDKGDDGYYSRQHSWVDLTIQPTDALRVSLNPWRSHLDSEMQYLDQTTFSGEDRFIFGSMHRETMGMTLRLDYCLTPSLTIQFYGQPYISAGEFSDLKRITAPRADKYEDRFHTFVEGPEITRSENGDFSIDEDQDSQIDYVIENPDFNFKEFNSNLVLRWEFRPGSTIYLVWSQGRTTSSTNGDFSLGDDMKNLFEVHPHNVFLFKVTRWFAL